MKRSVHKKLARLMDGNDPSVKKDVRRLREAVRDVDRRQARRNKEHARRVA